MRKCSGKSTKHSIKSCCPVFNTNRMVLEYAEVSYLPSFGREAKLSANDYALARQLAEWRRKIRDQWHAVRVEHVQAPPIESLRVGDHLTVQATVNLGSLALNEVVVQLFHGVIDSFGEIANPKTTVLQPTGTGNPTVFHGTIECAASGQYGFSVRVLPNHPALAHLYESGLVTWG